MKEKGDSFTLSFSSETKIEIAQRRFGKECCLRAAAYGVACFARYFDSRGIVVQTELEEVAAYARRIFKVCGVLGTIVEKPRPNGIMYEFAVKDECEVEKLHMLFGTTGREVNLQIDPQLLKCSSCVSAFVGSAFLCSGTIADPHKGYSFEILSPRLNLSKDLEALLAEHEFAPSRTRRKGVYVVYVKASGHVEDLLTFIGAFTSSMKVMDEKAVRAVRNQLNRLTNCETNNMKKRIDTNMAYIKAIRYLEQQDALEALSEPLRQAARLRCEYPDASLAELAEKFDPPIRKPGLAHRLKKLETIAADLQKRTTHTEDGENND